MNNVFRRWVLFMLLSVFGAFSALSFAETKPEFSMGTSPKWYYVKFKAGGMYLTGHGAGQPLSVESFKGSNDQLWMLSGNEQSFTMTSKDGYNINIRDGAWNERDNNCPAVGDAVAKENFRLHVSSLRSYSGSYEIESLSYPQKALNTWAGINAGTAIGLWSLDNSNNAVEFVALAQAPLQVTGVTDYQPAEKNTLWYNSLADNSKSSNTWMEYSLPIGNGQLGASVLGGLKTDEIIFNEKTLWTGTSTDVGTDGHNEYGAFQVFGAIRIEDQNATGKVTNYLRDLNLATATASMSYSHEGVDYKREYIVSYPDKVVATHLSVVKGNGKINIKVSLDPRMAKGGIQTAYQNGEAHFAGKLDVVSFDARMKVVAQGGEVVTNSHDITVSNADEVLIVLAGGTDFDNSKPDYVWGTEKLFNDMDLRVDNAAAKKWQGLYDAHLKDYQRFYDRVKLDFTGAENKMPTDRLVDAYQQGDATNTLMLEQLYYHYGRYLEIASSRGVNLPSNLQGIWTNDNKAAWNADIHANINVQMNYWPAETANMSEMHEPFLNYIIEMADSEPWLRYAKAANPKGRGWTCYTENNIFGGVGVWAHNYVIVNAWYCSHLWQHYRYTLDEGFLEKAFPVMLSAVQFWLDRLVPDEDGKYVCPDEYSPEHGPLAENGVAHAQQLVWELFDNTLKAVKVLGPERCTIAKEDLDMLKERFSLLDPGLRIETYTGAWGNINGVTSGTPILREWKTSKYTVGNNGHRHMSHLMCLYPFGQVEEGTDLFNAAVNSLKLRGDQSTGWSMGWKINLWARALNGNHAHDILRLALRHSTSYAVDESKGGIYYNLFDSHAPFQIDGNFGACAGVTEMLFQSHKDVLHFLPALPDVWASGAVSGLKGVGGFTVAVDWKNGRAQKLTILNVKGQKCLVKCTRADKALNEALVTVNGLAVAPKVTDQPDVFEIPSVNEKDEIIVDFTQDAALPQPAPDYSGTCGETLSWQLVKSTGALTISGTGAMYDYGVEQPAPWTEVAQEVKSIVLPSSDALTHIGARAFVDCHKVAHVDFLDNKLTIGADAFARTTDSRLIINDVDYANQNFPLNENTYKTIIYNRSISSDKWATVILPFSLNTETALDYNFYELSSATNSTVTFKYVRYPLANVPYMYKNAAGISPEQMISDHRTTIKADAPNSKNDGIWKMLGTYTKMVISGNDLADSYVLSGGKIMNSSGSLSIRPFRAYFKGPKFEDLTSRTLRILIEEEDGQVTDITDVLMDEAKDNGVVFDLSGRRVWQTVPGHIYIKNGKKFLAK